jgi:hypothetical protein
MVAIAASFGKEGDGESPRGQLQPDGGRITLLAKDRFKSKIRTNSFVDKRKLTSGENLKNPMFDHVAQRHHRPKSEHRPTQQDNTNARRRR